MYIILGLSSGPGIIIPLERTFHREESGPPDARTHQIGDASSQDAPHQPSYVLKIFFAKHVLTDVVHLDLHNGSQPQIQ